MALSSGALKQAAVRPPVSAGASIMLMRRWREFTTSGEPVRFLSFDQEDGKWVDVDREVAEELRRAFRERRVFAEAAYGGRSFLFDFLRMARIDEATAEQAALAWIDDRGACYFPAPDVSSRKRRRDDDDDDAESSSGAEERWSGDSRDWTGGSGKKNRERRGAWWENAATLEESDRDYQLVSRLFLSRGLGPRGAEVTAVRKVARGPRAAAFELEGQLLAAKRGDAAATPRFAWYGAPAEDVAAAVDQGITRTNALLLGARAYGDGVHLSPPQSPYTSAVLAKADETGVAHIVLCRVLMGRSEAVPAESSQSQPSSDAYDSAVDSIVNPHWYVVWSKDMNKRILPEFVVSFKCPNLYARESSEATSKLQRPSVARDMFPKLLAELEKFVPSHKCHTLLETYDCFKKGQIRKEQFTGFLRNYVGDKVLTTVAKKLCRGH